MPIRIRPIQVERQASSDRPRQLETLHLADASSRFAGMDRLTSQQRTVVVATAGAVAASVIVFSLYKGLSGSSTSSRPRKAAKRSPTKPLPPGCFDAVIVGAGPSGGTAAYYLAKVGAHVALLDKEHFPRDKYCGDAVCTPAIKILEEMGVLEELKQNNEAHFADCGGFVSPSGLAYIGSVYFRSSRSI